MDEARAIGELGVRGAERQRLKELHRGLGRLSRTRHSAVNDRQRLREAARAMEGLFLGELLKVMRKTVPETDLLGGKFVHGIYTSMLDAEYAQLAVRQRGFGLAEIIERQLMPDLRIGDEMKTAINPSLRVSPSPHPPITLSPPVSGRVTSAFGPRRDPLTGARRHHDGVDIAVPPGTPVRAVAAGRVVFSGEQGGYGRLVVIEHARGMKTLYAHNQGIMVREGETVDVGQLIAHSGGSGRTSGAHLHFEVRDVQGKPVDPGHFLETGGRGL